MKKIINLNKERFKFASLTLLLCALGFSTQPVRAEGSRDLYPLGASGSRANIEWRTGTYGPPGNTSLLRRTLLQVYANKDEHILLGSSTVGVGSGDIIIYGNKSGRIGNESLSNELFRCSNQRSTTLRATQGQIRSRAQELAGPATIINDTNATPGTDVTNGYIPCYYKVPANGIYYVVFHGALGSNTNDDTPPTGEINLTSADNFNNRQAGNVAAWDVTVRSSLTSTVDIKGRLFADYLALYTGSNDKPIESDFYIVTKDGYRYKTDLNGLDPNAFVIYGNDVGFYDSDGTTPLYRNVIATAGGVAMTQLMGNTSLALPTHTILFNNPQTNSGALDVITARGIPLTPTPPAVTNLKFSGSVGGNTSAFNTGGNFTFDTNVSGSYEIIISRDGTNFDPNNPNNRRLRGLVPIDGGQTVYWDGKDNSGNAFPVGDNYPARITLRNGEYHFPLLDAENSTRGGPSFTLLNATNPYGNTVGFYDDRVYRTLGGTLVGGSGQQVGQTLCGANPPNISLSDPISGFDTTSIQRAYGRTGQSSSNGSGYCDGSFGDVKGLDIWTYIPSASQTEFFNIVTTTLRADKTVALVEDNDKSGGTTPLANQVATPGDTLEYSIVVTNIGTQASVNSVVLRDTIPTNTTYVPGTLQITTGANNGQKSDESDNDQAEFNGTQVIFRLGTGANGSNGGTLGTTTSEKSTTIKFRVKINDPIPNGVNNVSNQAVISSQGFPDINSNDPNTSTAEDPTVTKIGPRLRLVKRITGIRKDGSDTTTTIGGYNNLVTDVNDNSPVNWPGGWSGGINSYLLGAITTEQIPANPGAPVPKDEVEYTIYFLSDGAIAAQDVNICDFIPANQTYVPGSMQMSLNGAAANTVADDLGTLPNSGFYPSTTTNFPAACSGNNNSRGAAYFRVGNVNSASTGLNPYYGYIRFRAKVN